MAVKFIFALAAVCLLQNANGLVRRESPPETPGPLEEFHKQASDLLTQWSDKAKSAIEDDEWKNNLKNGTDNIVKALEGWTKDYSEQLNSVSDSVKSTVSDAVAKMTEAIEDLRKNHPEVEGKAKEVSEKIQTNVRNVLAETDKVVKNLATNTEGVRGDLEKATKDGYQNLVKTIQDLSARANQAANKA